MSIGTDTMGDSGDSTSFPKTNDSTVSPPDDSQVEEAPESEDQGGCVVKNLCCAQLCCMIGTSPCFFCCVTCCPDIKESTSTRLMYLLMFMFTIALMLVSLVGDIPTWLTTLSPQINSTCVEYLGTEPGCRGLFGNYVAVYKVCAGQLSMHLILIVITICASDSKMFPGALHNGVWLWKWAFMIGVMVLIFLFVHSGSSPVWACMRIFGYIGGSLFIMVNLFFMCEVSMCSNIKLLEKASVNSCWYVLIWLLTILLLGVASGICYALLKFYSVCPENLVIAVANMVGCSLLLILTIIAGVGKGSKNADLLQGSVIISFVLYQTWSAIHSRPSGSFNTAVLGKAIYQPYSTVPTLFTEPQPNSSSIDTVASGNNTEAECKVDFGFGNQGNSSWANKLQYGGLAYYLFTALYKSVDHTRKQAKTVKRYVMSRTLFGKNLRVSQISDKIIPNGCCYSCKVKHSGTGQKVIYNEETSTIYNYCYLHFQFVCSILFAMMTLTNWFDPGADIELANWHQSWAGYWVEIVTSWLAMLVYICTLLLPLHCQDNPYYKKISLRIPQSRPPSAMAKTPRRYFDEQGDAISNLGSFEGVLYAYDNQDNLKPISFVKALGAEGIPHSEEGPSDTQTHATDSSQVAYPYSHTTKPPAHLPGMSSASAQSPYKPRHESETHDAFDGESIINAKNFGSKRLNGFSSKRSVQPPSAISLDQSKRSLQPPSAMYMDPSYRSLQPQSGIALAPNMASTSFITSASSGRSYNKEPLFLRDNSMASRSINSAITAQPPVVIDSLGDNNSLQHYHHASDNSRSLPSTARQFNLRNATQSAKGFVRPR